MLWFYRALHLRNQDRVMNLMQYPHLYYPEIYILNGGYREFFGIYKVSLKDFCFLMNNPFL